MQLSDEIKTSTFVYGTTRTTIPPTQLPGRKFLRIQVTTGALFVGGSGVTATGATKGLTIAAGSPPMDFELDIDVNLYGLTASGTASVSILEGA
jgi:hypothetical protein